MPGSQGDSARRPDLGKGQPGWNAESLRAEHQLPGCALNPQASEPISLQASRFLAAQAILLSLAGLPGIFFHSLVGSRGWPEGVRLTGHKRTVNRQKLDLIALETALADPRTLRHQVFHGYAQLLRARAAHPAFHPQSHQQVLELGVGVFALQRTSPDGEHSLVCLQEVSGTAQLVEVSTWSKAGNADDDRTELITGRQFHLTPGDSLALQPYQTLWLA
jgi:sucrose phosphorylase